MRLLGIVFLLACSEIYFYGKWRRRGRYLTPRSLLLHPAVLRTIVYLSIVYTVGQVVLAVSAIHDITDNNRDGVPDNLTFHM